LTITVQPRKNVHLKIKKKNLRSTKNFFGADSQGYFIVINLKSKLVLD